MKDSQLDLDLYFEEHEKNRLIDNNITQDNVIYLAEVRRRIQVLQEQNIEKSIIKEFVDFARKLDW